MIHKREGGVLVWQIYNHNMQPHCGLEGNNGPCARNEKIYFEVTRHSAHSVHIIQQRTCIIISEHSRATVEDVSWLS